MLRLFPRRPSTAEASLRLQRVVRSPIDELVDSTRQVPWTLTLAQLLWTAGPVTYLAMMGGHMMGYGEPVGMGTYVFFAIYVVLAALIGIVARITAQTLRGNKQQRVRKNLTRTLDVLPDMIFTVRDLHLALLPPQQRQREAAALFLQKLDLGTESVGQAVTDLSGDPALGQIARQVESFRRVGLFSRIRDLGQQHHDHIQACLNQVRHWSPEVAATLADRLAGVAPSQEAGVARGENFIGATFAAAHHEDLSLMSMADAEDLLMLSFELLSGREITRLVIAYEGDWQLARTLDELERRHNIYRQTKVSAALHLQDLSQLLIRSGLTSLQPAALEQLTTELLAEISVALSTLVTQGQGRGAQMDPKLRDTIQRASRYARLTRQGIEQLQEHYQRYTRTLAQWNTLRRQRAQADDRPQAGEYRGLQIRESSICLNDEHKLQLASQLCRYLEDLDISTSEQGIRQQGAFMQANDAKQLAIRLALILRPLIQLDDPSVQRALESSRAAYFEGLETGFSADAKAALGAAVVKEVQQDLGAATELIALRLTQLYRLPLNDTIVSFLCEHYGANRERLDFIASRFHQDGDESNLLLPHEPAMIRAYQEWRAPIRAAEAALIRLVRQR